MWVRFHRLEHDVLLTTNNGVEAQNKVLKEFYLKSSHGRKSLTGLISVLVQKFLPERKNNYQKENMRLSSSYRKYSSEVPEYLHYRPPAFIKHVMTRMCAAADFTLDDIKALPSPGTFSVRSQGKEGDYHVDYGAPSCTCADFVRVKCPCKHLCAIFQLVDGFSFSDLPSAYLNGPIASLDNGRSIPVDEEAEVSMPHHTESSTVVVHQLPLQRSSGLAAKREELRALNEKIGSALFYSTADAESLTNAKHHMEAAYKAILEGAHTSGGLHVRGSPTK
ncbi:unnamed protein product, partial [Ixodes hexagonus]